MVSLAVLLVFVLPAPLPAVDFDPQPIEVPGEVCGDMAEFASLDEWAASADCAKTFLLGVLEVSQPTRVDSQEPPDPEAQTSSLSEFVERGNRLKEAGQLGAALDEYRAGLAAHPGGSRDLFLAMGGIFTEEKRFLEALAALAVALKFDPENQEMLYDVGIGFENMYLDEIALEAFRRVVEAEPRHGRAQRNIGFVLLRQDKPEEALEPLGIALDIDPTDWKAHTNIATAYADTEDAIRAELKEIVARRRPGARDPNDPSEPRRAELVVKLHAVDYRVKTLEHRREAVRWNPDEALVWYGLGTTLLDRGDSVSLSEAITAFQKALAIEPGYYAALRNLVSAQKQSARYEEAYQTCLTMRETSGEEWWLFATMADIQVKLGRYDEAGKNYLAAIRLNDRDVHSLLGMAELSRKLGRNAESEEWVQKVEQIDPELARSHRWFVKNGY